MLELRQNCETTTVCFPCCLKNATSALKRRKLDASLISGPSDFRHLCHNNFESQQQLPKAVNLPLHIKLVDLPKNPQSAAEFSKPQPRQSFIEDQKHSRSNNFDTDLIENVRKDFSDDDSLPPAPLPPANLNTLQRKFVGLT